MSDSIKLPCGGIAHFDSSSGFCYRCETCMTVVGSIGQPKSCQDEAQKWKNWVSIGGQEWDYTLETQSTGVDDGYEI